MVRLTVDLIQESLQCVNPVKEYELVLRGLKIPVIENLGATLNQFDSIDLTDNEIRRLAGIPLLTKLVSLHLSNNRIKRISKDIAECIPNIQVLILTNNNIEDLEQVDNLVDLKHLWMLSLMRNPVAMSRSYRLHIIQRMPQIRILDFKRVTLRERQEAAALGPSIIGKKPPAKRASELDEQKHLQAKRSKLTIAQIEKIQQAIKNSNRIEEIERLTHMLDTGEFFMDEE